MIVGGGAPAQERLGRAQRASLILIDGGRRFGGGGAATSSARASQRAASSTENLCRFLNLQLGDALWKTRTKFGGQFKVTDHQFCRKSVIIFITIFLSVNVVSVGGICFPL